MKTGTHLAILLLILISSVTFGQAADFGSFTDTRDGTKYKTITIGTQTWMAENLNYDAGEGSWAYDDKSSNSSIYGRLYSWPAARKAAPPGWHLPSDAEWHTLVEYMGGPEVAGGKMKEAGTAHWKNPNTGATNLDGFSALGGGYRYDGKYYDVDNSASFWSATASGNGKSYVWHRFLFHRIDAVYRYRYCYENFAYSVRCVRDVEAIKKASRHVDYFHHVKQTCDALLEHGVDSYGPVRTGMIISMLDRFSLEPFDSLPPGPEGLRSQDRVDTFGHNANLQFNFYRVLYLLSDITGDPKYRLGAQADLSDFLKYAQSAETGLLGWGEHLFYDLKEDKVQSGFKRGKRYPKWHEMKRKLLFWDFFYKTNPQAVLNFARGLWDHQIYDQETGNFSRHALWDKHGPNKDYDFPKEGSYMIDVWSRSFQRTQDPVFQNAINVLVSRYIKKLNPIYLIDFDTARPDYCDNTATLGLAIECENAAKRLGKSGIGDKLEFLASEIDKGFLSLDHEPADPQKGFYYSVHTNNGKLKPRHGGVGYSFYWGMSYGRKTTAMLANLCYGRYLQLAEGSNKEKYHLLIVQAADGYLNFDPDLSAGEIWPVEYGMVIFTELAAYKLTSQKKYLQRAQVLCDDALQLFWDKKSPLPKASSKLNHYEAVTRVDTLLLALLAVYAESNDLSIEVPFSDIDR